MRELQYVKLMLKAEVVARPVLQPAAPPRDAAGGLLMIRPQPAPRPLPAHPAARRLSRPRLVRARADGDLGAGMGAGGADRRVCADGAMPPRRGRRAASSCSATGRACAPCTTSAATAGPSSAPPRRRPSASASPAPITPGPTPRRRAASCRPPSARRPPTFDRSRHTAFFPWRCSVWNGFVFLCLADTPPAFAPDIGIGALDNWPMDELVTGHRAGEDARLQLEGLLGELQRMPALSGHSPGAFGACAGLCAGHHVGRRSCRDGAEPRHRSCATGRELDRRRRALRTGVPGPDRAERAEGHPFVTLYPSMFVVAHVDYVARWSPDARRRRRRPADARDWLFPPETLAQPGFDLADVIDFATTVIAAGRRGLRDEPARPALARLHDAGRLMPQEFDVHRFHRWVVSRLHRRPETGGIAMNTTVKRGARRPGTGAAFRPGPIIRRRCFDLERRSSS